ncbi:MAG TPA: polysaccharide biosynthesis tyrosine autokinase [Candidatus Acidoferrales bacterium]|nr:polysaccharide biosynthesis tyrosine autokinase [Candidatus Acidoferrales bacterium]
MSRVFDALLRASGEKNQSPAAGNGKEDPSERGGLNGDGPAGEWRWDGDGQFPPQISLPAAAAAPRSWREILEELFFGWDLKRYKSYPIVVLERESPAAEQYKILREQIKRLRAETGARTISITSPVKQDGKTTVAVNLAAAIALEYEEQVLLIDADLRSPQVHRYFNVERGPGLADYLSSSASDDLSRYVKDSFLPGLKLLCAGQRSELSPELLAKLKMRDLLEQIRLRFPDHQIIVDTPPVLSTPDPLIVSREVDGIIMVVRARRTPKDYLAKSIQTLNSTKLMGIVLNDVSLGMGSRYYYYYSRSSE